MAKTLPERGVSPEAVFAEMEEARATDVAWREGRLGLYVHFGGEDVLAVAKEAYQRFFSENALGRSAFPSLAKFETEVVGWTAGLLNADERAAGNISSGGTESIFLAVKAMRDWARSEGRGGDHPHIVAPYSAHPAFNKAAHLLGMTVSRGGIGDDYRAVPERMAQAVRPDTVGIVGSAPGFPHGVIDPIEDIAAIAREYSLWLHVDACVGGFILPFARQLQYRIPTFDFALPEVRSMSADLHKYGFAAKGASTVVYRSDDDHRHQIFDFDEWPRGRFSAPTMAGTRPGGAVAAAWAVMRYLGNEGYLKIVRSIMETRDALIEGINAIDELHVNSDPEGPIITYSADGVDIFAVAEEMTANGWFVTRGAEPPCIHMGMLTAIHVPIVERYLDDLKTSVRKVRREGRVAQSRTVTYGG